MNHRWHGLLRPQVGSRVLAAIATLAALWPVLVKLPRVAVVACFDAAHPLYALVPTDIGAVHCVTAPAPVIGWTLMIGVTLLVQGLLLPIILGAAALLVRGLSRFAATTRRRLALALLDLAALVVPQRRPVPIPIRVSHTQPHWSRVNPRRGPPCGLS
ncbi:MAG: hypothetical protein WAL91_12380 [Propionicimonas sp.]